MNIILGTLLILIPISILGYMYFGTGEDAKPLWQMPFWGIVALIVASTPFLIIGLMFLVAFVFAFCISKGIELLTGGIL